MVDERGLHVITSLLLLLVMNRPAEQASLQHGQLMTKCNDLGLQLGLLVKAAQQAAEQH